MGVKVPRKYDVLVRFLRETIINSKSERIRYAAAERLDGIYERHEQYAEKAAARRERAELRALATQGQGGAIPSQEQVSGIDTTEETDESQHIQSVFDRLLRPKEGTDAAAE